MTDHLMTPNPTSPVTSTRAGDEMIQADSIASEKVCDHPSTEKAGWRDIASAPKDRWILAGYFKDDLFKMDLTKWDDGSWWCMTQNIPTHWQPLPAPPAGQVIAHPANSLRSLPESSDPSLLGRETVREETIEECAKIAQGTAPVSKGNFFEARRKQTATIVARIRALSPLKE